MAQQLEELDEFGVTVRDDQRDLVALAEGLRQGTADAVAKRCKMRRATGEKGRAQQEAAAQAQEEEIARRQAEAERAKRAEEAEERLPPSAMPSAEIKIPDEFLCPIT